MIKVFSFNLSVYISHNKSTSYLNNIIFKLKKMVRIFFNLRCAFMLDTVYFLAAKLFFPSYITRTERKKYINKIKLTKYGV